MVDNILTVNNTYGELYEWPREHMITDQPYEWPRDGTYDQPYDGPYDEPYDGPYDGLYDGIYEGPQPV